MVETQVRIWKFVGLDLGKDPLSLFRVWGPTGYLQILLDPQVNLEDPTQTGPVTIPVHKAIHIEELPLCIICETK